MATDGPGPVPPLVSSTWVAEHADRPDVLVLEVDREAGDYHEGHVPGAFGLDRLDDLHHTVRKSFASSTHIAALLGRFGATPSTHVVLLGDSDNVFAASTYWLLRHFGHHRLSLMDGGKDVWLVEGRPTTTDVGSRAATDYAVPVGDPSVRVGRDDILDRFVGGPDGTLLLDCRSEGEFTGRRAHGVDLPVEHHRVPGRIPGSVNVAVEDVLDPVMRRFRPVEELRAAFAGLGVAPDTDVALYCRMAHRSSLLWFVLRDLLEHPKARNYDGGWAEYGSLVDGPVDRGP